MEDDSAEKTKRQEGADKKARKDKTMRLCHQTLISSVRVGILADVVIGFVTFTISNLVSRINHEMYTDQRAQGVRARLPYGNAIAHLRALADGESRSHMGAKHGSTPGPVGP